MTYHYIKIVRCNDKRFKFMVEHLSKPNEKGLYRVARVIGIYPTYQDAFKAAYGMKRFLTPYVTLNRTALKR